MMTKVWFEPVTVAAFDIVAVVLFTTAAIVSKVGMVPGDGWYASEAPTSAAVKFAVAEVIVADAAVV